MIEDAEQLTTYPYELQVCDDGMYVTPTWSNFCDQLKALHRWRGLERLSVILEQELTMYGAINPPGDYIRFKTEEQRTWFVLRFA
jgi:hypothetical protein